MEKTEVLSHIVHDANRDKLNCINQSEYKYAASFRAIEKQAEEELMEFVQGVDKVEDDSIDDVPVEEEDTTGNVNLEIIERDGGRFTLNVVFLDTGEIRQKVVDKHWLLRRLWQHELKTWAKRASAQPVDLGYVVLSPLKR